MCRIAVEGSLPDKYSVDCLWNLNGDPQYVRGPLQSFDWENSLGEKLLFRKVLIEPPLLACYSGRSTLMS